MFLDDELLQIARSSDLTKDSINKCIVNMLNACFNNMVNRTDDKSSQQVLIATLKRVDKTWEIVADKLIKENRGFIKRNGFRLFIENKEELKHLRVHLS